MLNLSILLPVSFVNEKKITVFKSRKTKELFLNKHSNNKCLCLKNSSQQLIVCSKFKVMKYFYHFNISLIFLPNNILERIFYLRENYRSLKNSKKKNVIQIN